MDTCDDDAMLGEKAFWSKPRARTRTLGHRCTPHAYTHALSCTVVTSANRLWRRQTVRRHERRCRWLHCRQRRRRRQRLRRRRRGPPPLFDIGRRQGRARQPQQPPHHGVVLPSLLRGTSLFLCTSQTCHCLYIDCRAQLSLMLCTLPRSLVVQRRCQSCAAQRLGGRRCTERVHPHRGDGCQ